MKINMVNMDQSNMEVVTTWPHLRPAKGLQQFFVFTRALLTALNPISSRPRNAVCGKGECL